MITTTRYAIFIKPDPQSAHIWPNGRWHAQGLPKDPTDFGFAILYGSHEQALKAATTGKFKWRYTSDMYEIVPIQCAFNNPVKTKE